MYNHIVVLKCWNRYIRYFSLRKTQCSIFILLLMPNYLCKHLVTMIEVAIIDLKMNYHWLPKNKFFNHLVNKNAKNVVWSVISILLPYTFHFIRYCSKRKNCKIIKLRFLSKFYRLSFIKLSILTGQINQINQWVILPTAKWVSISTAINQLQFIPTHFFRYVHHRVIKMCTNHRVNLLGHTQNFVIACLT